MKPFLKIYTEIVNETYESMSKSEIGKNEDYEVILGGFNNGVVTVEKSTRRGKEHGDFPSLSRPTTYSTFRYIPKFRTLFWWNHEDSVNEVRKDKAENALRRLGYNVDKHDSIFAAKYVGSRDRENYRNRGISITHDINKSRYNYKNWEESYSANVKKEKFVILGVVSRDGEKVISERCSGFTTHGDLGMSNYGSRFRYLPTTKLVYWWNLADITNEQKIGVENSLNKAGFEVINHVSIHSENNYSKSHLWKEAVKVFPKDRKMVDKKTLSKGAKVEKEHTPSKKKAETIALQHIKEFPKMKNGKMDSDYYRELDKMEKKLGKNE